MPLIGRIFGGLDFSSYFLLLGPVPAKYTGSLTDYAALKKAGAPLLGYGAFVTQAVNFLIVAFIIFLIVRGVSRATAMLDREAARLRHEAPVAVEPAPEPVEIALLREIRDELKARPVG